MWKENGTYGLFRKLGLGAIRLSLHLLIIPISLVRKCMHDILLIFVGFFHWWQRATLHVWLGWVVSPCCWRITRTGTRLTARIATSTCAKPSSTPWRTSPISVSARHNTSAHRYNVCSQAGTNKRWIEVCCCTLQLLCIATPTHTFFLYACEFFYAVVTLLHTSFLGRHADACSCCFLINTPKFCVSHIDNNGGSFLHCSTGAQQFFFFFFSLPFLTFLSSFFCNHSGTVKFVYIDTNTCEAVWLSSRVLCRLVRRQTSVWFSFDSKILSCEFCPDNSWNLKCLTLLSVLMLTAGSFRLWQHSIMYRYSLVTA